MKNFIIVLSRNRWNFSQVKCVSEGVLWNFYDEVKILPKNHILLDIGTAAEKSFRNSFCGNAVNWD